ncbi:bacillithiol system redox-active protein YtxJ [Rhodohalobacter barkolensis]|uniref:Bacillithiol system redox-active protein YtxJ n=1 Tax=Rhodohalobacter barkolensis TaxID=2053187 RepID=A0A2N0VJ51_9BACT|nr:bacillithiol system redox-active protein YtxJ [Rhodohalobacter barkolensis]PKD44221.1 bacillithiol system redox-active protein YtxJ [Rhodohalobacter barkolensis]
MSFLSGLRGMVSGRASLSEKWLQPEAEEDLDKMVAANSGKHVIYKHSYSCAVCLFSKLKVEEIMDKYDDRASFHFVDVLKNRALSRKIADMTGLRHESPQIIVLNDGKVFWHESHSGISKEELEKAILS